MPKIAIVRNASNVPFYVTTPSKSDTLVKGTLTKAQTWSYSNESVSIADFSSLITPGGYQLIIPGVGQTIPFQINQHVHLNLAIGSLKGYYYQRASTALLPAQAGTWARAIGHPDTVVLVHSSAATLQRPAGTIISCLEAGTMPATIISISSTRAFQRIPFSRHMNGSLNSAIS